LTNCKASFRESPPIAFFCARLSAQRLGLDTEVAALARLIGVVEVQGGEFEHAYDY
jgi:hypothetical protein